jgi:hypothetical protein
MIEVYETIGYLILGFVGAIWLTKVAKWGLRDYFAAKAMQALIDRDTFFDDVASSAYKVADHMMKARKA